MREIKFRAFDQEIKRMGQPFYPMDSVFLADGGTFHESCVFMQYTGLEDKNGKEIFEGDVVMWGGDELPVIVVWSECYAGFGLRRAGWMYTHFFGEAVDPTDCEVIGNIHENPELLKQ